MLGQRGYREREDDPFVRQIIHAELHISDASGRIIGVGASKCEAPTVARWLNLSSKTIFRRVNISDLSASHDEQEMRTIAGHDQDRVAHKGGRFTARLGDIFRHVAVWSK